MSVGSTTLDVSSYVYEEVVVSGTYEVVKAAVMLH